ncbi:hypothetical protein FHS40_009150 [Streptomyces spectabilis]|uniref:Helix-turn-helix domain-containing protein n=1 Tax=Streptomyces spectabilis TaxID=68270 RepID=A0A7W8F0R0_STRST|nr:hypothetical protein [Streptomyces spectabilis]
MIVDAYQAGESVSQIAQLTGRDVVDIGNVLAAAQATRRR